MLFNGIRIDRDKTMAIGQVAETGKFAHPLAGTAAAMKSQYQRDRVSRIINRRHINMIRSFESVVHYRAGYLFAETGIHVPLRAGGAYHSENAKQQAAEF